jgi:putative transposase
MVGWTSEKPNPARFCTGHQNQPASQHPQTPAGPAPPYMGRAHHRTIHEGSPLWYTVLMPEYRRMDLPGGTFFLTLVTHRWQRLFRSEFAVENLRTALQWTKQRNPFEVLGAVVLPEHIHFLWTLPPGDSDFSTRVSLFKRMVSTSMAPTLDSSSAASPSRRMKREREIWQRRFWEHTIRGTRDLELHLDYIHYNPVKHGHATCPHKWASSSFQRWVRAGMYEMNWHCSCREQPPPPGFEEIAGTVGE